MAARKIAHPSVNDRKAKGLEARDRTALSGHTKWRPAADRPDPVGLLTEQDVSREQDLVPVRHGRMMVSPFTFYRGAAKIMAADLADTPVAGLETQLCGDAHLSNFGLFASPERVLLFDVNDFDETLPGPFEWDVKRMAASFAIAGRNNGFAEADTRAAVPGATGAAEASPKTFPWFSAWQVSRATSASCLPTRISSRYRCGNTDRAEWKRLRRVSGLLRVNSSSRAWRSAGPTSQEITHGLAGGAAVAWLDWTGTGPASSMAGRALTMARSLASAAVLGGRQPAPNRAFRWI